LKDKTIDLYTPADIAKVRDILLKEQKGKCAVTSIDIKKLGRTAVLDHRHDSEQLVRAVLEREVNAFEGLVTNAHRRCLSYWLPTPLPDVLRALAAYLEASESTPERRWRHTGWIAKMKTLYNKLTTKQRDKVLETLGCTASCTNDTARKKEFAKLLKDRKLGYTTILAAIESAKR
jgi:hypothetical protein